MLSAIKKILNRPLANRAVSQRPDASIPKRGKPHPANPVGSDKPSVPNLPPAPAGAKPPPKLSAFKKIFGRPPAPSPSIQYSAGAATSAQNEPPQATPVEARTPSLSNIPPPPTPRRAARAVAAEDSDSITLPLSVIVQCVPKELHGKLAATGAAGCHFTIPKTQVLEQLPRGAVRVPFGELRRSAPSGLFTNSHANDSQMVDLPLNQILQQMRPEDYTFRSHRQVEKPPADISNLFGENGECLTEVRLLSKHEILKGPSDAPPKRPAFNPPAAISPPAATSPPIPDIPLIKPVGLPFTPPAAAIPMPKLQSKPAAPEVPNLPAFPTDLAEFTEAPAESPGPPFLVALDNIAAGWPEEIRQEIAGLQIPHVKCAFPSAEICNGLMAGKMQFKWAQLRARIHPALLNLEPSDHGETLLELPLNIITPLFLEFIRSTSGDQRPIDAEQTTAFFRKARETTKFYRKKPAPVPPVPAPAATAPKAAEPKAAAKPQSTTSFRKKSHTTQFVKAATGPGTGGTLTLSLSLVSSSWPPLVLKEIQQHNLSEAKIEMPLDAVEPGLKRGKIEFPWKQIYSWLKPPPSILM